MLPLGSTFSTQIKFRRWHHMKTIKRLFWVGLGTVLALAPTLTAFAGADYGD